LFSKLVVLGFGKVGQANAIALQDDFDSTYFYDENTPEFHYLASNSNSYKKILRLNDPVSEDSIDTLYWVCVNDEKNIDGTQDISKIKKMLNRLSCVEGARVLRSTVLPHHLSEIDFDYYSPEFLHERNAIVEAKYPNTFALGSRKRGSPPNILQILMKRAAIKFVGTPEEVAFIKYYDNIWKAAKITIVNELGDIAKFSSLLNQGSFDRVMQFNFSGDDYQRYGQAFTGKCLPKDLTAFIRWAREIGSHTDGLDGIVNSNERHEKQLFHSGLEIWNGKK
jgi:UDP-glucose 6-dehydrogenase